MFLRALLLILVLVGSNTIAQNTAVTGGSQSPDVRSNESHPPVPPPETPIPPDCNRADLLRLGHPVFISERRSTDFNKLKLGLAVRGSSLAYGVSLEKYVFEEGQPIRFHIWVDNASDQAAFTLTCSDLEWFADNDFRVYDAKGRRVESNFELTIVSSIGAKSLTSACASTNRGRMNPPIFCLRNVPTEIPAHTCKNTGDQNTDESFTGDLTKMYDLPVGKYTLRTHTEATVADPCNLESTVLWYGVSGRDITFDIQPRPSHR